MATTPNFNWSTPDNTGLVKNGALDIRTLGNSIDASLVDLKGGTTGQVLTKASNTDMDFSWVADASGIPATIFDAKGDLIAASAADTAARLAVGSNGQVLTADSTAATGLAWATASSGSSNVAGKNGIINSNFSIWQRGTSIAVGTAGTTYTADRWLSYRAVSGSTVSRQATGDTTNLPFIQYAARVQRDSGNTSTSPISLYNNFETINAIPFAGRTVTLSYYARAGANYSGASSALNTSVTTGTGTDQSVFSYSGAATPINFSPTLTTTWQRFSTTATIASSATQLYVAAGYTPVGTAGANDWFEITGVQLEIAASASAYSPNTSTYATELAACQRYYWSWSGNGIVAEIRSASQAYASMKLPITMRTAPTATFLASPTTSYTVNSAGKSGGIASIGQDSSSADIYTFNIGLSGYTAGQSGFFFANSGTQFSAEL
jgi:hypothetical protein